MSRDSTNKRIRCGNRDGSLHSVNKQKTSSYISDDKAINALLGDAKSTQSSDDANRESQHKNNYAGKTSHQSKRQRREQYKDEERHDSKYDWGKAEPKKEEEAPGKPVEKEKPNFGLSGALAKDEKTGNVYNGVILKFSEPPEARTPNTRWRLYVFKKTGKSGEDNDAPLDVLHISKQSAYLFGRDRKVADIPVDHTSLSKQHCVIQYRALPDKNDRDMRLRCKPYLIDLGSTNGTFLNEVRLDEARYYELRKGDVITLGASSREYVLLTENTTST